MENKFLFFSHIPHTGDLNGSFSLAKKNLVDRPKCQSNVSIHSEWAYNNKLYEKYTQITTLMDNEITKITNTRIYNKWVIIINTIDDSDNAYASNFISSIFTTFGEYSTMQQIFICSQLKCIFVVRFMRKLKRLMSIELYRDDLSKFNPALYQNINSLFSVQLIKEIVSIFHFYYNDIITTILNHTLQNPKFADYTKNFCILTRISHIINDTHVA